MQQTRQRLQWSVQPDFELLMRAMVLDVEHLSKLKMRSLYQLGSRLRLTPMINCLTAENPLIPIIGLQMLTCSSKQSYFTHQESSMAQQRKKVLINQDHHGIFCTVFYYYYLNLNSQDSGVRSKKNSDEKCFLHSAAQPSQAASFNVSRTELNSQLSYEFLVNRDISTDVTLHSTINRESD